MEVCGTMTSVSLQNEGLPCSPHEVLDSLWISSSSHHTFQGNTGPRMVNFGEAAQGESSREKVFFPQLDKDDNGNENYDNCFHQPEKKRRLTVDQVHFLEKSFEVENKLEPERKIQLAKELGLQPRQIAIWFQNRRARYKSKQLEKEYDCLKSSYDKLKADYDTLLKENEKMKNEVQLLTEKLRIREKGMANPELCDPISPLNAEPETPIPVTHSINVARRTTAIKQEDASSAKSDIFDSDSPHCTDGNHSSLLEPDDSSNVFEAERSDFSQDGDETSLSRTLLQPTIFPKPEDECYEELQANSSNLGFPIENHGTWFWPY